MDGLDFWICRWACTWEGGRGTNTVTRELDGHVVSERFDAIEPEPFHGLSVSVLGSDAIWRQTWVDSTGNYWHFEGGPQEDGSFIFATPGKVNTDHLYKRMVFSEITDGGFAWRWEFSADGDAWERRWAIAYRRA